MVSRIWAPVSRPASCSWGNLLSPTLPSCFLITQSPLLLLSWPVAPPTPITHFHFFIALSVFPACSPSPDTCSSLEYFSSAYFFCICLAEVMSVSALCVCVYFLMLIFFFRSGELRGEQELTKIYLFWKRYSYSLLTWFKGLCHLCPATWCCSHKHLGSLLQPLEVPFPLLETICHPEPIFSQLLLIFLASNTASSRRQSMTTQVSKVGFHPVFLLLKQQSYVLYLPFFLYVSPLDLALWGQRFTSRLTFF